MARPTFVLLALSLLAGGALVSAFLLLPSGSGIGVDVERERDREASAIDFGPMRPHVVGRESLFDRGDARGDRGAGRMNPQSAPRTASPILPVQPDRALGDVGEHLDPDALYPVWASSGIVSDVGNFEDTDYDLLASIEDGAAYIGEYIEPEEAL